MSASAAPMAAVVADVNRDAYFVWHKTEGGPRTYACADLAGLRACIFHLTGRDPDSFPLDDRGLPKVPGYTIADRCHIYSGPRIGHPRFEIINPPMTEDEARVRLSPETDDLRTRLSKLKASSAIVAPPTREDTADV